MLVAPDVAIGVGMISFSVLLAVLAFVSKAGRRGAIVVAAWLIGAALFGGRALAQGMVNPVDVRPDASSLTVLSWNAQGVPPEEMMDRIIAVVEDRAVDMVVLPETGSVIGERAAAELERLGWRNAYFGPEGTAVIVRRALADAAGYQVVPGNPPWAGIAIVPSSPSATSPAIVAVHVQRPSPGHLGTRAEHLAWVRQMCEDNEYVLAVGDFNSTLNQLGGRTLGRCADVAVEHRAGAVSTWPTWLPSWLGVSIDRAMVGPPFDPAASTFEVLRDVDTSGVEGWGAGAGTDHWPILVSLAGEQG